MGIISGLIDGIATGIEKIAGIATDICGAIGGAVMNAIGKFVVAFPGLGIGIEAIRVIVKIICVVADILINKPKEETPEEIGVKAERCKQEEGLTPEDFASTEEYIEHLRKDIKVDQEKMNEMSEEQLQAYAAVGVGLYVRAMEERYGIKMEPEFWRAVYKAKVNPEQVPALIQNMKACGVESGKLLDSYLDGTLVAGSPEQKNVFAGLTRYAAEFGLEAPKAIQNMRQEYHRGGTI